MSIHLLHISVSVVTADLICQDRLYFAAIKKKKNPLNLNGLTQWKCTSISHPHEIHYESNWLTRVTYSWVGSAFQEPFCQHILPRKDKAGGSHISNQIIQVRNDNISLPFTVLWLDLVMWFYPMAKGWNLLSSYVPRGEPWKFLPYYQAS